MWGPGWPCLPQRHLSVWGGEDSPAQPLAGGAGGQAAPGTWPYSARPFQWVLAFEIFIPLVLFFILLGLRQKKPTISVKEGERLWGWAQGTAGQSGWSRRPVPRVLGRAHPSRHARRRGPRPCTLAGRAAGPHRCPLFCFARPCMAPASSSRARMQSVSEASLVQPERAPTPLALTAFPGLAAFCRPPACCRGQLACWGTVGGGC